MDNADEAFDLQEMSIQTGLSKSVSQVRKPSGASECEDCGNILPRERREAAPWATHCVPCQELVERRLTQRRAM